MAASIMCGAARPAAPRPQSSRPPSKPRVDASDDRSLLRSSPLVIACLSSWTRRRPSPAEACCCQQLHSPSQRRAASSQQATWAWSRCAGDADREPSDGREVLPGAVGRAIPHEQACLQSSGYHQHGHSCCAAPLWLVPLLQAGDRVVYSKYAGTDVQVKGEEHVLLKVREDCTRSGSVARCPLIIDCVTHRVSRPHHSILAGGRTCLTCATTTAW